MELSQKLQLVFEKMKISGVATISTEGVTVDIDLNELAHIVAAVKAQESNLKSLETLLFQSFDKE